MAGLGIYHMGGYGRIGVYRVKSIREEFIKSKMDEFKDDPNKFWNELSNKIPGNKCKNNQVFNLMDSNSEALSNDVASTYVNNYFATIGGTLAADIDAINQNEQTFPIEGEPNDNLELNQLNMSCSHQRK